jgi:hypothetical protein
VEHSIIQRPLSQFRWSTGGDDGARAEVSKERDIAQTRVLLGRLEYVERAAGNPGDGLHRESVLPLGLPTLVAGVALRKG